MYANTTLLPTNTLFEGGGEGKLWWDEKKKNELVELFAGDDWGTACTIARLLLLLLGGGLGSCLSGGLGGSLLGGGLGSGLGGGSNLSSRLGGGSLGSGLGSSLGSGLSSCLGGGLLVLAGSLGSGLLLLLNHLLGVTAGRLAASRLTTLGDLGSTALLGLEVTLLEELGIVGSLLAGLDDLGSALGMLLALVLDATGGDQTLDTDSLEALDGLAILGARLDLLAVGVGILADIIILAQVEELPDLAGSLGTETAGNVFVSDTGQLGLSLLDNDQVEGRHVRSDNASTDRLSLALSVTSGTVSRVTSTQQEANTALNEHTLHHGETLFVISTSDFEDITLELVS